MPPKAQQPSKKAEAKAKQKIIEDKTFGLKNKNKSAKVSKYIQSVEKTVKQGNRVSRKEEEELRLQKERKKQEEAQKAEVASLFKPVAQQQKVAFGVDPKTVLCAYFKPGQCTKGDKCKFSHDVNVERKAAKINVYEDARLAEEDKMENWDQSKLTEVVRKKHSGNTSNKPITELVCKHFLEAIETRKYGWFWECPNGGDKCKYRHALPPDFVLKSASNVQQEEEEEISLEEFLETERYKIEKRTPVTAESFAKWKAERNSKQEAEQKALDKTREADFRAGRLLHVSGRDLFAYKPELFAGDDEEAMDVNYNNRDSENEQVIVEDEALFLQDDLENLKIDDEVDA